MDNRSSGRGGILDHVAITLSGLCLIHCLLLPAIIVALPLLAQFNESHFPAQMLIVVITVRLIAFALAYRRHGNKVIVAWGFVGIAIMFVGGTAAHANYGVLADTLLTMAGSLILATAHFFNNRLAGHVAAR